MKITEKKAYKNYKNFDAPNLWWILFAARIPTLLFREMKIATHHKSILPFSFSLLVMDSNVNVGSQTDATRSFGPCCCDGSKSHQTSSTLSHHQNTQSYWSTFSIAFLSMHGAPAQLDRRCSCSVQRLPIKLSLEYVIWIDYEVFQFRAARLCRPSLWNRSAAFVCLNVSIFLIFIIFKIKIFDMCSVQQD